MLLLRALVGPVKISLSAIRSAKPSNIPFASIRKAISFILISRSLALFCMALGLCTDVLDCCASSCLHAASCRRFSTATPSSFLGREVLASTLSCRSILFFFRLRGAVLLSFSDASVVWQSNERFPCFFLPSPSARALSAFRPLMIMFFLLFQPPPVPTPSCLGRRLLTVQSVPPGFSILDGHHSKVLKHKTSVFPAFFFFLLSLQRPSALFRRDPYTGEIDPQSFPPFEDILKLFLVYLCGGFRPVRAFSGWPYENVGTLPVDPRISNLSLFS